METPKETETTPADWAIAGFPGEIKAAAYLVGELAAQYRVIVDILDEQREFTLTGVGHDELNALLQERLPHELYAQIDLDARMNQLVQWGTCNRIQDEAQTQADFLRNRYRYQLSTLGYEINQATKRATAQVDDASTSATVAPENIVNILQEVIAALRSEQVEDAANKLAIVHDILKNMREAANIWQSRLAASLSEPPSEENVRQRLSTILAYADKWGVGVDAYSEAIAELLPFFEQLPDSEWRRLALTRQGSQASEEHIAADTEQIRKIIEVLAYWFTGTQSQSSCLRRQIRDAVTPMLQGQRALLSVGGVISRKNDILRLATAIEQSVDDRQAWEIWSSATGLFTTRHVADRTPESDDPYHESVWETAPVQINQRLRKRGPRTLQGRAPGMPDRTQARQAALEYARIRQLRTEQAIAKLRARSGTTLDSWEELGQTETEILLDMLSQAQASAWPPVCAVPPSESPADSSPEPLPESLPAGASSPESPGRDTMQALSADGKWRLEFSPVSGPVAVIHTPEGRLVIPNYRVEFVA